MNCVINTIIDRNLKKGEKLEVISQHLRKKYNINIDPEAIKARMKVMQLKYN